MPYSLVQAGDRLYRISPGGVKTDVSLPEGVFVNPLVRARFAVLERQIVGVGGFTRNIVVDAQDVSARPLSIAGPTAAPTLAATGTGDLQGTYRYQLSFVILGVDDRVLSESPLSPVAGPITVAGRQVSLTALETSPLAGVNARRLYRTADGGTEYFLAATIPDNTSTTVVDGVSDYDLALLPAADALGNPPGTDDLDSFRLLIAWKDRLWASPAVAPDDVWFSENRRVYGWSPVNRLTIKPVGQDQIGVTAFMARRDDLLIGKRRSLWMTRGSTPSTIQVIQIAEAPGPVSQDAALVVHDIAYYLAEDGVYEVTGEGIRSLTDDTVRPWFTTDDYFERAFFPLAFATWNPAYDTVQFYLASAGSMGIDRWIAYDRRRRHWLGPHKTDRFEPTYAGVMDDAAERRTVVVGSSEGHLYREDEASAQDDGVPIDLDLLTVAHHANTPDIEKYWGELSVFTREEALGSLAITPHVGALRAPPQPAIAHDLTRGRVRHRRLGTGRVAQLRFRNAQLDVPTELYGYEIPYHELGRR